MNPQPCRVAWTSKNYIFFDIFTSYHTLVSNGRAPFGQHKESRPLAGSDFLSMRREFVSHSQPIRFIRLDSEHAQNDGNSVNRVFPVLTLPEVAILGADQKEHGLWGRECPYQILYSICVWLQPHPQSKRLGAVSMALLCFRNLSIEKVIQLRLKFYYGNEKLTKSRN